MSAPSDTPTHHDQHGRYPEALTVGDFQQNLSAVQARIDAACHHVARDPVTVRLLPVSKTKPEASLRMAHAAGCRMLGENKVQEAYRKWKAMQDLSDLQWSVIGHLQTNKAKLVARFASEFQALDSLRVAEALDRRLQVEGRSLDVFVQVNTSGEASKYGLAPEEVPGFIQALPAFSALRVRGLMTLALFSGEAERVRQCFVLLRTLRDRLRQTAPAGIDLDELSMGMSGDFEIAIEEGSTVVRVGQAIFGARALPDSHYWPGETPGGIAMTGEASLSELRTLPLDVVSVQSQVAYGRVGNNVAIPALEALGLSVAAVPTVVFSNTPHYPTMHGGALPIEWFEGYLQDLSARGALHALRAILVGYLGNPEQAEALTGWVRALLKDRADLRIVIDPVMGDYEHGIFVNPNLVGSYRRDLLPLADGLTPNSFELAHLTGLAVSDVESVITAARTLLTGRTQWVAVTSAAPDTWPQDEMQVVLVTRTQAEVIAHPYIHTTPKGTGDLFCATLTGHWVNGAGLSEATAQACRQVMRALRHTEQLRCAELLLPPMANSHGNQETQLREYIRQFTYQIRSEGFSMKPATSHLMRAYARQPVSFVRGNGALLWDEQGVEYLDAIAGVAVTSLGHAHPEIAAVIAEQAGMLLHTSNVFRIDWQERLGERLCALTGMQKAFFCNSGAEANETALKLARLHGHRNQVAEPKILVMENGFHGRTIATLSASGNPSKQQGFEPLLPGFLRVPYNDIEAVRQMAANESGIVAVLIEPVQGEGGIRVASTDYLRELRTLCNQHGWLLMLDEIQAGMGRTGAWFGHQHASIEPDVMTLAKALGNGFPIGACLARGVAADLFSPGQHGSTFGGNPLACRVACTVLDIMTRDKLPERAAVLGTRLLTGLQEALSANPQVEAIRGQGLMVGIELSKNCKELVGRALAEEQLLITVTRDTVIRLLPPLICDETQIDDIVMRVTRLLSPGKVNPNRSSI